MLYSVSEVFYSLQGEGYFTGHPAIFIRFAGCNLKCPWCFGVKPSRRIPRLIAPKGKIKLNEVKIGDKLLTYNDSIELVETEVTKVIKRKVTKWLEITINGILYFVTPEHPFFTNNGLVLAQDLKVGDIILHSTHNEKMSYHALNHNSMFNPETVKKSTKNKDYKKIGEKISEAISIKKKKGNYTNLFHLLSKEKQDQLKKNLSEKRRGENNPNWKGGVHINHEQLKKENKKYFKKCEICHKKRKLEVHHIDKNPNNDCIDNLINICHKCHSKIHKRGYNFWNDRKDKKILINAVNSNGLEVQKIKEIDITSNPHYGRSYGPKELEVYNVSCQPYSSYLIDYMWVHNCDTDYSSAGLYTFNEIMEKINFEIEGKIKSNYTHPLIVLTGGEPTLQDYRRFIKNLRESYWEYNPITIETNGRANSHLDIQLLRGVYNIWITTSPKIGIDPNCDSYFQDPNWKGDELKIVLDPNFEEYNQKVLPALPIRLQNRFRYFYIQPCSNNLKPAIEFVKENPIWKLSLQTQKFVNIR